MWHCCNFSLLCDIIWSCKDLGLVKDLAHTWQTKSLFPLWSFKWHRSVSVLINSWLQWLQCCFSGLSVWCLIRCNLKPPGCWKVASHWLHTKLFSRVWRNMWVLSEDGRVNIFPHSLQPKCLTSLWISKWFFKCSPFLKDFVHCSHLKPRPSGWPLLCSVMIPLFEKLSPQNVHTYLFSTAIAVNLKHTLNRKTLHTVLK